jgi:sRNA-binding carbon storage regulator CsrA
MLVLTRGIGQTVYIGRDISVTVYDRMRFHATLAIVAPSHSRVRYGSQTLGFAACPEGERLYLVTLLDDDAIWIDEAEVRVAFATGEPDMRPMPERCLRLLLSAPKSLSIYREEVYLRRLRERGETLPAWPMHEHISRIGGQSHRRSFSAAADTTR